MARPPHLRQRCPRCPRETVEGVQFVYGLGRLDFVCVGLKRPEVRGTIFMLYLSNGCMFDYVCSEILDIPTG